jgi:hypothetical protein
MLSQRAHLTQHRSHHDLRTVHRRFGEWFPPRQHRTANEESGRLGLPSAALVSLGLASTLGTAQSRANPREDRSFHSRFCAKEVGNGRGFELKLR